MQVTSLEELEHPQPFIITDEDGYLSLVPKMRDYLSTINHPLVVIAIAGIYRTGKSYLLNRLMNRQDGFPLGPTVQSKTKGIWIWLARHPFFADRVIVLIDTEGLADTEKANRDHDVWIFALSILLSNIFVFNSKGNIDNNALNDLHLTTELSEHMRVKASGKQEEVTDFSGIFPQFIWAVRDFFLNCEIEGKEVTPNEYLEWNLRLKRGMRPEIKQANDVRSSLKDFFPDRHCFLFPFPVTDQKKLATLESVRADQLTPEFRQVSKKFVEFVLKQEGVKELEGKAVNGSMFVTLIECYLTAIRNKAIPCIENAVDTMRETENAKAKSFGLSVYDAEWKGTVFPIPTQELNEKHSKAQKAAVDAFVTRVIFDKDNKAALEMGELLGERLDALFVSNSKESEKKTKAAIEKLWKPIQGRVETGGYMKPGGYKDYMEATSGVEKALFSITGLGDEVDRMWTDFTMRKETERLQILRSEERLNEKEKKAEEERAKRQEQERLNRLHEEHIKRLGEEQVKKEKDFKDGMDRLNREMKAKADRERKELSDRLNKQNEECQRLMKEGFEDRANTMRKQMDALKADMATKVYREGK